MSYDSPNVNDEKPVNNENPSETGDGKVRTPPDEEKKDRDPLGGDRLEDVEGEIAPSDVE